MGQRKAETLLVCVGLLLSTLPQVWTMARTTEITTSNPEQTESQYSKQVYIFNRTSILLLPSYIRATDYSLKEELVTTIRWEFMHDDGVWGVKFDSFSLPYTEHCTSDYLSISDPSGQCDHQKTIFCGSSLPDNFVSCSSKIVVEYHSQAPRLAPDFNFRVDYGMNKDVLEKSFRAKFVSPTDFEKERVTVNNEEEKVVIISLSVILPVAMAILGMLAFILARHNQQEKACAQQMVLPTKCPPPPPPHHSIKKYVHHGNTHEKDSTVVKLFVEDDKKVTSSSRAAAVRAQKIRLQDQRDKDERVPLNDYTDMPVNICTSVAVCDVPEEEALFEDRPNGYLGLM
ncbi:uncharacterized protein LOC106883038 [Argonauta hians]